METIVGKATTAATSEVASFTKLPNNLVGHETRVGVEVEGNGDPIPFSGFFSPLLSALSECGRPTDRDRPERS